MFLAANLTKFKNLPINAAESNVLKQLPDMPTFHTEDSKTESGSSS